MAMTSPKWRKAMNREHLQDDLIELGAATVETRGGPDGVEDEERTRHIPLGLTDD